MEGFLNFRMRPWLRRLITRVVAIIPAAITVYISGEEGTYRLLILSQVILSLQLPFAVIPLIHFTSDRARMGEFVNARWVRALAWTAAAVIAGLNIKLVIQTLTEWIETAGSYQWIILATVVPLCMAIGLLLVWVTLHPWLPRWMKEGKPALHMPEVSGAELREPAYRTIMVPLDHTDGDREALSHSAALARAHNAKVFLVHVEEGVTSQFYGDLAASAEIESGLRYFRDILESLRAQEINTELVVRHSSNPGEEIVRVARELKPDLVVMGAHGHKGLKDILFGATINAVRHDLRTPLLIVRDDSGQTRTPDPETPPKAV
jgi:manganese transport protein